MCIFRIFRNLLLVMVMQLAAEVSAEVSASDEFCHKGWQLKDDKCFYVSDQYANFYVAKEKCESMKSELAPVYSLEDLSRLASVLIDPSQICNSYDNCAEFWIGVFDSTAQNTWTSTNGTLIPEAHKFWDTGYPKENGHCVLVELGIGKNDFRAAWKNEKCARPLKYICISTSGVNLALRRRATQSSTLDNLDASIAVDGNPATVLSSGTCAHVNDGPGGPNWWRIELDRPYRVQRVTVTNRRDCCADRLDYFIVGVTNSTADPVRGAYPLCGHYQSRVAPGATVTVNCNPSTSAGQYVIIQQPSDGPGWLTLCEVEVYGGRD